MAKPLVIYEEYLTQMADSILTTAFDYSGGVNLIYMGRTQAGNAKNDPFWQIKKFTYDGSDNLIDIQWAGGSGHFDKSWDDRATYEYK